MENVMENGDAARKMKEKCIYVTLFLTKTCRHGIWFLPLRTESESTRKYTESRTSIVSIADMRRLRCFASKYHEGSKRFNADIEQMPHSNLPLCSASIDGELPPSKDWCRKSISCSRCQIIEVAEKICPAPRKSRCVEFLTHNEIEHTLIDFRSFDGHRSIEPSKSIVLLSKSILESRNENQRAKLET